MNIFVWSELADQREPDLWPLETHHGNYVGLITAHLPERYWTVRQKKQLIASGFCIDRELAKAAIEQIITAGISKGY